MRDFINFLCKAGFQPFSEADIVMTGGESRLIRAKDDKQGSKSLYYSLVQNSDGTVFGHFYSCRAAVGDYWCSRAPKDWTPEEKARYKRENEARIKALEEAKEERYLSVSDSCRDTYKGLIRVGVDSHPYAQRKGITVPDKVKMRGNELIIPAIDMQGRIWTLQSIDEDGGKKFTFDGKKKGAFFPIGWKTKEPQDIIYFCEGFATGCTIAEAMGKTTIVCFDAGNLLPVAKAFREKYPDTRFVFAADNDQWAFKNPKHKSIENIDVKDVSGDEKRWDNWRRDGYCYNTGIDKASQAATAVGGYMIAPDIPSNCKDKLTDFNDMGIEYTRDRLSMPEKVLESVMVEEVEQHHATPSAAPSHHDVVLYNADSGYFETEEPTSPNDAVGKHEETVALRGDGNPAWFDDMIWDKEPTEMLTSIYGIKTLHDGKSMNNLIVFLRGHYPKLFVLNEFSDEIIVSYHPPWQSEREPFFVHRVNDADRINCSAFIEHYGFSVSDKTIEKAIISIAEKDKRHPVREFFDSLAGKWDGVNRLDHWLKDYTGSLQDAAYLSAVGSKWLIAAVARIYKPGCQFSHVLVFEGRQDIGKSKLLRELSTFGDDYEESYFTDAVDVNKLNQFSAMMWQGKLIIELSELGGMDRSDIERVKAWISRQDDEYQKKGSNDILKRPRQFVIAGTTNKSHWINDSTGGKRFWPVACEFVDVEAVKSVKMQLWAEAVTRYKAGEQYWISDDDDVYMIARKEQAVRMNIDEWQEILEMSVSGKEFVLPREIYDWLHIDIGFLDGGKSNRIRTAMQALGYEYKQAYKLTGNKNRVWVKT